MTWGEVEDTPLRIDTQKYKVFIKLFNDSENEVIYKAPWNTGKRHSQKQACQLIYSEAKDIEKASSKTVLLIFKNFGRNV